MTTTESSQPAASPQGDTAPGTPGGHTPQVPEPSTPTAPPNRTDAQASPATYSAYRLPFPHRVRATLTPAPSRANTSPPLRAPG